MNDSLTHNTESKLWTTAQPLLFLIFSCICKCHVGSVFANMCLCVPSMCVCVWVFFFFLTKPTLESQFKQIFLVKWFTKNRFTKMNRISTKCSGNAFDVFVRVTSVRQLVYVYIASFFFRSEVRPYCARIQIHDKGVNVIDGHCWSARDTRWVPKSHGKM